ncbi:hypothetical protein GCM10007859_28980 [Brevundimonas denitrificans]|uniref:Zinc finger CHC2-type domain-containing protein n=1 Tax=Brevundimonas denitrificans TaxID=1443434 RepID=A0ABQ6BSK1_9CAUL|nr:CHC2 zinc finger domain-containing protein [Brevundimonas denitrificans]GLS02853.1 hypothetical protein GCM10007859_28980 [Brevundimonas denitrificans]
MTVTATEIKNRISPDHYYSRHLKGHFGRHTGHNWYHWNGLCPFHPDRKPGSFVVNRESGAFKCFACGVQGGDILSFHMQASQLSFRQALRHLQEVYP